MDKTLREKIKELENLGIDVHNIERRDSLIGGGINFEFWLKDQSQIEQLPQAGDWAANTSTALIVPTGILYGLSKDGWGTIG